MTFIHDAIGKFKLLIDAGAGIFIFKKILQNRFPDKLSIQEIVDQQIFILESESCVRS